MSSENLAQVAKFETLRSIAEASLNTTTYTAIGAALVNPARLLHITNTTDVNVFISFDGTNAHAIVITSGFVLYDLTANKSLSSVGGLYIPANTTIYAKLAASATTGSVYVGVMYGFTGASI